MSVRHCGLRDYLVFASIGVSYCCEFIPNQIVTCRALGAGAWAGVAETTTGATGAGSTADAVVVRSLSVTRRTVSDLASSGWRKIRDSRPILPASRIFCASFSLNYSGPAFALFAL